MLPIVGAIALFVMNGFIAGTPHANRFGEPPSDDRDEAALGITHRNRHAQPRAPKKPLIIDQTGCASNRNGTA